MACLALQLSLWTVSDSNTSNFDEPGNGARPEPAAERRVHTWLKRACGLVTGTWSPSGRPLLAASMAIFAA